MGNARRTLLKLGVVLGMGVGARGATSSARVESGRSVEPKLRESVRAADFGAVGDGRTDDRAALQAAIDHALDQGVRRVDIGPGTFIINGTLQIAGTRAAYKSLELRGATGAFLGHTKLRHHASQKSNPLLNIQASRSVRVADIAFYGNNVAPTDLAQLGNGAYVNSQGADWVSSGIQERRYAPYAGIAIDALTGRDPGPGENYTFGDYGQNPSSKLIVERCRIMNFLVGAAVGPRNSDSGTEDIVFRDCTFVENKFQIVTTGSQQRAVIVQDCNAGGHWCNFDNVTFGRRIGQPITVRGALINKSYRLFQTSSDIGLLEASGIYCESVASIGIIGRFASSAFMGAHFSGCNFSLIGLDDDGTAVNKDEVLRAGVPVNFTGCAFVSQFMFPMSLEKPVVFDTCQFRCESAGKDTTPGEQESFGVYVPEGQEHRILMRNCEQRVYSGTPKLFDDEPRLHSIPNRAYIMPNTSRITVVGSKTSYKLASPPLTRTARISGLRHVSVEEVAFSEDTKPTIIMPGDVLDWKVHVPVVPGSSPATAVVPALRVTSVEGTRVTCKVTGNLDKSYSPGDVPVRVRQFINRTASRGEVRRRSAEITNVTHAGNFQVGDWIYVSEGESSDLVRIRAIVGSTITCDRALGTTAPSAAIYNTLLTAL